MKKNATTKKMLKAKASKNFKHRLTQQFFLELTKDEINNVLKVLN
jgi:hypothetical protein